MKKDVYDTLSDKEKIIYDELVEFSRKLSAQLEALTQVAKKLLDVATLDP